jgi:ribose transport system substrate-binding protein
MSLKKNESRRNFFKATAAMLTVAVGVAAWGNAALAQDSGDEKLSLAGKRIGISAVGTDHHWDLMAYQGIIDEVKANRLRWMPSATTRPMFRSFRR